MELPNVIGSVPDILENVQGLYKGNLEYYFAVIFDSKGANNPYHNIRHSLDVLTKCHKALEWYIEQNTPIDKLDARVLLCAALFHDMDHPGRAGNDDFNIQFALRKWTQHVLQEDESIFDKVSNLIKMTEFRGVSHVHDTNLELAFILRDADTSQAMSPAWLRLIVYGLASEIGVAPKEMLKAQLPFLENLHFESLWGKAMYEPLISQKIIEATRYIKIIEKY